MELGKPVEWAIRTVRNEAEDIVGYIRQADYFCEKIVILVDPESWDNTYDIIKYRFPKVILLRQDRTLGDSDNNKKGPEGNLIAHLNQEWAVNRYVKDGQWVMKSAPDERFDPKRWKILAEEIRTVRRLGMAKGIMFTTMHNFYPDDSHCIDFYSGGNWGSYSYIQFFEKSGHWVKGGPPHSGSSLPFRLWWSLEPFYHYNFIKKTRIAFGLWRDVFRFRDLPRYELKNPIPNWRELNGIDR